MISLILAAILSPVHAQVQTCVWPNKCAVKAAVPVETCQWPNKCETPVHTCDYPNKCS